MRRYPVALFRWLIDRVRLAVFRMRYVVAGTSFKRTRWAVLDNIEVDSVPEVPIVIIGSRFSGWRRTARRLSRALVDSEYQHACAPSIREGIPTKVVAGGFEAGHDGSEAVLLPLLAGETLRRNWASYVSVAGRPSGRAMAVKPEVLRELVARGIRDEMSIRWQLRKKGPWLVVWAATHDDNQLRDDEVSTDDVASLNRRRDQGRGQVVEYTSPTTKSPGNPAPPPAAVWVGSAPVKTEPGIDSSSLSPEVSVRHAAPDWSVAQGWGDHHFAQAFSKALARQMIGCRVAPRHVWDHPYAARRVVITLRGLVPAPPVTGRLNVLWIISHPEEVSRAELEGYDLVAVASQHDLERISSLSSIPTVVLLQATDREWMRNPVSHDGSVVFIGNSRGVNRRAVAWAVQEGLYPKVYGSGWEEFLHEGADLFGAIPPNETADRFNRAGVVLADHWDDMRRLGYVSNRIFDVAAAAGVLVTDTVRGVTDLIPDTHTYADPDDLRELVKHLLERDQAERLIEVQRKQRHVLSLHTFDNRVDELLSAISDHVEEGSDIVRVLRDSHGEGLSIGEGDWE